VKTAHLFFITICAASGSGGMEVIMKDILLKQIKEIAKKYNCEKVILFGSRARGDNSPVSDYDIAVFNKNLSAVQKAYFFNDIDNIATLKKIDVVFVNNDTGDDLIKNIKKEGVVIYEQT
jgi:predicted nucleotidyltransferase